MWTPCELTCKQSETRDAFGDEVVIVELDTSGHQEVAKDGGEDVADGAALHAALCSLLGQALDCPRPAMQLYVVDVVEEVYDDRIEFALEDALKINPASAQLLTLAAG